MSKYHYVQDQKVTVWNRVFFDIEANSQEEADEIAKQMSQNNVYDEECVNDSISINEQEQMSETEEFMTPDENDGNATLEIYRKNDYMNCIAANSDLGVNLTD